MSSGKGAPTPRLILAPLPRMALREPPTRLGILPSQRQEAGRREGKMALLGSEETAGVCTAHPLHHPHPVLFPLLERKQVSIVEDVQKQRKPKKEEAKRLNLKISGKRTNATHANDTKLCKLECESAFPPLVFLPPQLLRLWRCLG